MWPMVSEPASPHSAASGISPMPALSSTIKTILSKAPLLFITFLFTVLAPGRVVAFAGADLRALSCAADLDADSAKAAVVRLVGRVVAEAVLCANFRGDLGEG